MQGNFIGTQADGTSPLGNHSHGINVEGSGECLIGGTSPGAANVIAFNGRDGVALNSGAGAGASILANSIHSNADLAVDLGFSGVTPNDPGDADEGSNHLQNFPDLASAFAGTGGATVRGSLDSAAGTAFRIELFANASCDPSGYGEAQTFLGALTATTDATGQAVFSFAAPLAIPQGQAVSATATDPEGNTSELSRCVQVESCPVLTLGPPSLPDATAGAPYQQTLTATGSTPPHAFGVTGGALAHGLTLSPAGELSGSPTAAGTFSFNVTAGDLNNCRGARDYTLTVNETADLSITKTASVDPAEVGRIFTYNINVLNAGPDAANAVTLTDALPAPVTFNSATPSQGSCAFASGTLTCQLGQLAAHGSAGVALQVKPRQTGPLSNTASVTAAEPDSDGSNNDATSTINVIKTADLKVSKSDSPDPVFVGEQVTYTMVATNLGPLNTATGVALTDSLPAGVTFVSATTTQGSIVTPPVGSNGVFTADIGSLAVGAQATVTVTVKAAQPGAVNNTATVSANETDVNTANTANNAATQTTTVKDAALQKVLLTKQVLIGGCENTTGNVYLTGPAPPGGFSVALSSNVTGASVPASVFIPAGQTVSPAFALTTSPVSAKQVGLVTATSGTSSASRGITVNVGSGSCQ